MTGRPTATETPTRFKTPPTVFTRVSDIANQLSHLHPPLEIPAHLRFVQEALSPSQIQDLFSRETFHLPDIGPLEKEWPTVGHRASVVIAPLKAQVASSGSKAHTPRGAFCYFNSTAHVGQWLAELDFHFPNAPDRAAWVDQIEELVHARDLFDRLKVVAYGAPSSILLQNWTDRAVYGYVLEENRAPKIEESLLTELTARLQEPEVVPELGRITRMTRRAFPPERLAQIERETQEVDEQIRQVEEELSQEYRNNPEDRVKRANAAFEALVREAQRIVAEVARTKGVDCMDLARGPDDMTVGSFAAWKNKVLMRLGMAPSK